MFAFLNVLFIFSIKKYVSSPINMVFVSTGIYSYCYENIYRNVHNIFVTIQVQL